MINSFRGEYAWMSNMYMVPITIELGHKTMTWKSTEHVYQAMKCSDSKDQQHIFNLESPYKAKKYSRLVKIRDDWDNIKLAVMEDITFLKYSQHPYLAQKLIDTGNEEIEEGNTWHDNFWGNCTCSHCDDKIGLNHLGEILMKFRGEIRANI